MTSKYTTYSPPQTPNSSVEPPELWVQYVLDSDGDSILPIIEAVCLEDEHGYRLDEWWEACGVLEEMQKPIVQKILNSLDQRE